MSDCRIKNPFLWIFHICLNFGCMQLMFSNPFIWIRSMQILGCGYLPQLFKSLSNLEPGCFVNCSRLTVTKLKIMVYIRDNTEIQEFCNFCFVLFLSCFQNLVLKHKNFAFILIFHVRFLENKSYKNSKSSAKLNEFYWKYRGC